MLRTHEIKARALAALRARINNDDAIESRADELLDELQGGSEALQSEFLEFCVNAPYTMNVGSALSEFTFAQAKKELQGDYDNAQIEQAEERH